MGHPDKLRAAYKKNEYLQYPYKMSSEEQEMYQQYSFAMQQYHNLVNYLNSTSTELNEDGSQKGYGRGEFGLEKEMDDEMVELLKEKVANVITTAQVLYGKVKDNPKLSTAQKSLLYSIQQNLNTAVKENSVLENLDTIEKMSYMEMHARSTDVIIDVGEDNLDRVGMAASSRITIRYMDEGGKIKSGFFTEDVESGVDLKSIYDQHVKKDSPTDMFFRTLDVGPNGHDPDLSKYKSIIRMLAQTLDEYSIDPVSNLSMVANLSKELEADLKALKLQYKDCENIYDFVKTALPGVRKDILENSAHQKEGLNINQRNTAMSDIATALGMPNLLAKSTPMTIIRNGKAVHGNFMDYAEGVDIDNIDPASELMGGKALKIDYGKVVTDACDMMVLDYICLNGDRHQNNHFYKIVKDTNGNPVLSGFQGIDNDMSFGSFVPEDNQTHMKLPPLNDLKFITRKTADMVNRMTEAQIHGIMMGKGFSNEEIAACWSRVQKMQAFINRNDGTGPEILENTPTQSHYDKMKEQALEYNDYSKDHPELDDSTLTPILNTLVLEQEYNGKLRSFKNKYPDRSLREFQIKSNTDKAKSDRIKDGLKNLRSKVYIDEKMTMKSQRNQIKKLFRKMKSPRFYDNKQYKEMYKAVEDLNKTLKDFQKDVLVDKKVLTADVKANILSKKFKATQKTINEYVANLPNKLNAKDDKMLSVVHALGTICMEAESSRERQVNALNNIMKKTYKEVGRVGQALAEAEEMSFEKAILQNEFNAKMHLGAFVGNCAAPNKEDTPLFADDFAKILVSNKLQQLKITNPQEYAQHAKNFENSSNALGDMVEAVKNNANFKKLMKEVNPVNALVNNTISEMSSLGEDMKLFDDINVAPKLDGNSKGMAMGH